MPKSEPSDFFTHPKYVRAIKGQKTDRKDSKWIADLFKCDLVRNPFIPPSPIRALRELNRYRAKLVNTRTAEKNRYQDSMVLSNVRLSSVLSDPFGRTATDIMGYLTTSDVFDADQIAKLVQKGAKQKTEMILRSIEGLKIPPDQLFKMQSLQEHKGFLDSLITKVEIEIFVRSRQYGHFIDLLTTIPGFNELSATLLIAEIGANMDVFQDADHLASWAGLAPGSDQSAGKKKSTRVSRAGVFLKPLLVQCALAATRCKTNDYFAVKYRNLKRRRGHKKAVIAIARMMLVCAYHMLDKEQEFNPSDLIATQKTSSKESQAPLTEESALDFLQGLGYSIQDLQKAKQQPV